MLKLLNFFLAEYCLAYKAVVFTWSPPKKQTRQIVLLPESNCKLQSGTRIVEKEAKKLLQFAVQFYELILEACFVELLVSLNLFS